MDVPLPYPQCPTGAGSFPNLAANLGPKHLIFFRNLSKRLGCREKPDDLLKGSKPSPPVFSPPKVHGGSLNITATASTCRNGSANGGNVATGVKPSGTKSRMLPGLLSSGQPPPPGSPHLGEVGGVRGGGGFNAISMPTPTRTLAQISQG